MSTPRFITATEVLNERKQMLRESGDPGHSGSGFWGFMPDCFCYNCRTYYDPTGAEIASYLNCMPSFFDKGNPPSFLKSPLLNESFLAARGTTGLFAEFAPGQQREETTLDAVAAALRAGTPPVLIQRRALVGGHRIQDEYISTEGGYRRYKRVDGSHVFTSTSTAAETLVITVDELPTHLSAEPLLHWAP